MSLTCAQALGYLADYAIENLESGDRRQLREHLADCLSCREAAAHADPGLLFAGIGVPEISAEERAMVLAGVRAGIAWKKAERKLSDPVPRRRRGFAAGAAVAVIALSLLLPGATSRRSEPPANARLTPRPMRTLGSAGPAAQPAAVVAPAVPTSKLPATIYDWSPGGGEPRVVWIVDRSLDI